MEYLRRETKIEQKAFASSDLADQTFAKACPALAEFLGVSAWEDGTSRETGTLLLFLAEGRWKGMLKDRDAARVAFLAADTVQGLFTALEKGLRAGTLDWRADKGPPKRGR